MALTKYTQDTNVIGSLGTTPEDRLGMTDQQLKDKFDENAVNTKTFLNDTMIPEIDALINAIKGAGWTSESLKGLADLVSTKSDKSTIQNKTLSSASWVGSVSPYTYTLSVTGITATSVQEILPTTDITEEELTALLGATLQDGGQSAGSITLKAWGEKPTIDIPIRVILRGDM